VWPVSVPDRVQALAAERGLGALVQSYLDGNTPATALYHFESGVVMAARQQSGAARWDEVESYYWTGPGNEDSSFGYTIGRRDGTVLGTVLEPASGSESGPYYLLGGALEKAIAQAYLPGLLADIAAGRTVDFGPIQAAGRGLSRDGGTTWTHWDDLESVAVAGTRREAAKIALLGERRLWPQKPSIRGYPAAVLAALAGHFIEARLAARVPDLVSAYRQGSALTFGRLSLSLRGLSVSGGPAVDWRDIKYLHVHLGERVVRIRRFGVRFRAQKVPSWQAGDATMLGAVLFSLGLRRTFGIAGQRTPTIVLADPTWPTRPIAEMYRPKPAEVANAEYNLVLLEIRRREAAAGWPRR
jgi:hypothetical protein